MPVVVSPPVVTMFLSAMTGDRSGNCGWGMRVSDIGERYFTRPVQPVQGGVNWEAYSHDELYQMVWQDADVADVSTVAVEWATHRDALATHAAVLREQSTAVLDSWQGAGAEKAATSLGVLAARVEKISELAHAGGLAAQDAADALATARAQMPAPPGNPAAPTTAAMAAPTSELNAPSSLSVPSLRSYLSSAESSMRESVASIRESMRSAPWSVPFGVSTGPDSAATTTLSSAISNMGTAFGAVGLGGASFYTGTLMEDMQKAQAVRAMQTYESSLTSSGQLLSAARDAVPSAAPLSRSTEPAVQTSPAQSGAGVPWQRLVGAASAGKPRGGGGGGGVRAVVGGPGASANGASLGSGARVGVLPGVADGPVPPALRVAETAAGRAGMHGAMVPPVGARGAGAENEEHVNQMPTLDHRLFAVEEPTMSPVIDGTGEL